MEKDLKKDPVPGQKVSSEKEPDEQVTLKRDHQHGDKHYKAGDTVSLPKSDAEFVRKAQGIK